MDNKLDSIGTALNSVLSRYNAVKAGVSVDSEGESVNMVEKSLNSMGIAIRNTQGQFKDFNTVLDDISAKWQKFDQVQQNEIVTVLGGTRQRNYLLTLLNNENMVLQQQATQAQSAGNALERYSTYADSTKAKLADLVNVQQQFYMKLLNSNAINSLITALINFVKEIDFLVTETPKATVALVALSTALILIARNFKAMTLELIASGGEIGAINVLLKMFFGTAVSGAGILATLKGAFLALKASMSALFLTPAGLVFLGIATAIGIATAAVTQHTQHMKALKEQTDANVESYKALTDAMEKNDVATQKTESDKLAKQQKDLQDLIAKSKELKSQLNQTDPDQKGAYSKLASELNDVNNKIQDQIKVLTDAGFAVNQYSGEILQLSVSESNLKIEDTNQKISDLVNRYVELAGITERTTQQDNEMLDITNRLKGSIDGLTISTDANGQVTGISTKLLGDKKITTQDLTKTIIDAANKQIEADNANLKVIVNNTEMTLTQLQARIDGYKAVMSAYDNGEIADNKAMKAIANMQKYQDILDKARASANKYFISYPTIGSGTPNSSYIPPNSSTKSTQDAGKQATDQEKAKIDAITKVYEDFKTQMENKLQDIDIKIKLTPETDTETLTKLNEEKLKIQNELEKQTETYLGNLKSTTVKTADAQDQLAKAIDSATKEINNQKSAIIDIQKTLKDTAENDIKDYIEAMKTIDEMTMEQKHANEKANLEKSIYDGMTKDEWTKANQSKIDAIDAQIDQINKVADAQDEVATRIEKQNNLIKLQTELENIKNNENVQTLQQQADGSWQYKYTYDEEAYKSKQDEIKNAQDDLNKWEIDTARKHQIDLLNQQKQYYEDLAKTKEDSYNQQLSVLEKVQQSETDLLELHYKDIQKLTDDYLANLVKTYGDNWDAIVKDIAAKVSQAKSLVDQLEQAKAKAEDIRIVDNPLAPVISTNNVNINVDSNGAVVNPQDETDYIAKNFPSLLDAYLRATGKKYATGGLNTETGIAWLDGTPSKPELVLNAQDTQNLLNAVKLTNKFANIIPNLLSSFKLPDFSKLNLRNNDKSSPTSIKIDRLEFPNVTDGNDVVDTLRNLPLLFT